MWSTNRVLFIYLIVICILYTFVNGQNLRLVSEWKSVEYDFDSEADETNSISNGNFVRGNAVLIDVDIYNGDSRIFVTAPRFTTGIPASLGTVTDKQAPGGPRIRPYPDWNWHTTQNCGSSLISVFRVEIDRCNRIWILDSGRIGSDQTCPPYLYVFDLTTDQLINSYEYPSTQYYPRMSLFIMPVVDVLNPPSCDNVNVYVADVNGFGIIVYDLMQNRSWRVNNKLTYPYPNFGTFTIAGETFDLMDGIFSMALTPQTSTQQRQLYFHSLAAITENRVSLSLLDNSTLWLSNADSEPREFKMLGNRGTHATAQSMDKNGNLFFGLTNPIGIACWDSTTNYNRDNMRVVLQNDETLQFVSSLKIIDSPTGEENLWAVSCRFQKAMTGTMSTSEINFRIQMAPVTEILDGGQKCKIKDNFTSNIIYPN